MSFLKILKAVFIPGSVFDEITEENLRVQKMNLGMTEYKKWLRKKGTELAAARIMRREEGLNVPDIWTEKINLLEREMEETERF